LTCFERGRIFLAGIQALVRVPIDQQPWLATHRTVKFPPWGLQMEHEMVYGRLEAARAFRAANGLNRVTVGTPHAWLGIAAAGTTYYDLREALAALGLDDDALRRRTTE
jgi:indolepyruvate ferredoxin oxidoreductase